MDRNKHQKLVAEWKEKNGPCVLCGRAPATTDDHLPPKSLYPKILRTDRTYFYTFPACHKCNNESSDNDFLLSAYLAIVLNQVEFSAGVEIEDPDRKALFDEFVQRLQSEKEGRHRRELMRPYNRLSGDGNEIIGINHTQIPVHPPLVKFIQALYWIVSGGEILQEYNPGIWVYSQVDPSREAYVEKILKQSFASLNWDDRFIARYNYGPPGSGADGFISASLHFYSERSVEKGATWFVMAVPSKTVIKGQSLFDRYKNIAGEPLISPI